MAVEVTTEGVLCYYSKGLVPSKADLCNVFSQSQPISSQLPLFECLYRAGCYVFVLEYDQEFAKDDLKYDNLRPWNSASNRCKVENFLVDGEKVQHLRVRHPVYEGLSKKAILSDEKAVVMYHFSKDINFQFEKLNTTLYSRPSTSTKSAPIFEYRTIRKASFTGDCSTPSHCIKQEIVDSTDGWDINKMSAAVYPLNGMVLAEGVAGKPELICIVIFEEALRLYLSRTGEEPVKSQEEQGGGLPGMELTRHTTCDLSQLCATVLLGNSERIRSRPPGEERPIMLGVMLHSSKSAKAYKMFEERIEETWKRVCKYKMAPSIGVGDSKVPLNEAMNDYFNEHINKLITRNLPGEELIKKIIEIHQGDLEQLRPSPLGQLPSEDYEDDTKWAFLIGVEEHINAADLKKMDGTKRKGCTERGSSYKRPCPEPKTSSVNNSNTGNDHLPFTSSNEMLLAYCESTRRPSTSPLGNNF